MSEGTLRAVAFWNTIFAVICAGGVLVLSQRLFNKMRSSAPEEIWQSLGAPKDLLTALRDPQRRWHRFMQTKAYLQACPRDLVTTIMRIRRAIGVIYAVLIASGGSIAIAWWLLNHP